MKNTARKITAVQENSIAEEMEIEAGDLLLSVNGQPIQDIFDYMFLTQDEYIEIAIQKSSGEEWLLEIEKEESEDLGLEFESGIMDDYRSCHNKCVFCFIDQMPPGMRETLYFKDDDSRLSFLQGNYVTLTNMSMENLDRIIRYNMSPINVSFQTMNPDLRCKMLNNRFAGDILEKVQKLADAGIEMNGQIVLCKNLNDGAELDYSIEVLSGLYPSLRSVSVVPVGLTKFRENLYPLESFSKEDSNQVLDQIEGWQKKLKKEFGVNFVYASDEWYLQAGREMPADEEYDGYIQLENGVGMMRLLETEVDQYLEGIPGDDRSAKMAIASGKSAGPFIEKLCLKIEKKFPNIHTRVYVIRNDFFGEKITVSGLITGQDLMKQLKEKELGSRLLIPINMLRAGEKVFLDDYTIEDVEKCLGVAIRVVDNIGEAFCRAIIEEKDVPINRRRQIYEQTDCSYCGET